MTTLQRIYSLKTGLIKALFALRALYTKPNKLLILSAVISGTILVMVLMLAMRVQHAPPLTPTFTFELDVKAINGKLTQLSEELSSQHKHIKKIDTLGSDISQLTHATNNIQKDITTLKQLSEKNQSLLLHAEKQTQATSSTVNQQLVNISKAVVPEAFLPASNLPFEVVGLDFWNNKAMLSIARKSVDGQIEYRLMSLNMSVENWTLTELNVTQKFAIFHHKAIGRVKVSL